jgi:exodeoxyribonuclease V gamma subunit
MIHLTSASSPRSLAAHLAELLADDPSDPMTPEWLAVPSHGMRRWLSLELARHLGASGAGRSDGIAANIIPAFPGDLRTAVLAVDRTDADLDPWHIERMVWTVLEVIDGVGAGAEDGLGLPTDLWANRFSIYARARRIADLFDRYHLHRPQMIRSWSQGRFVDGSGRALAGHAAWQPRLWSEVRRRMPEPSPPERLPMLLERMQGGEQLLDLPRRLVLFGFTVLPAGDFLAVARAVAVRREVHLFLLEPTRLDPDALRRSSPPPGDGGPRLRINDPTSGLIDHPLLRSWGRLHRESALLLAESRPDETIVPGDDPMTSARPPSTLLGRLQHDIRTNVAPSPTLGDDPSDRSVQFHACFGATRQVEVLRDTLLHLLASPGTDLSEDDIVVLCPSLDRFAPLVEAVFGRSADPVASPGPRADSGGAPALRYRITDQSIRQANPVLQATSALLALVTGRFAVASVLEFLALGPVRERYGFDDDDLAIIAEWAGATRVRWGLDAEQRGRFGLPGSVTTNTWNAALDQLLMGSAVEDGGFRLAVGSVAPFGVEGGEVGLLGNLADAIRHLADLCVEIDRTHTIAEWVAHVRQACLALFDAPSDAAWQMEALERLLFGTVDSATTGGAASSVLLEFGDVRKLLDERLDDRVGRADFFRGGITVTSMRPLRWVPFRVVALLGMDQSAFGSEPSAGDDLSAAAPQVGDRDPRGEVRESLLEALLAAEDCLVVLRDGRDVRTNQAVPPAVATSELFEAVLSSVNPDVRERVCRRLEIDHPRQAFDERCFEVGGLVEGTSWGFDQNELNGALARRHRSPARPAFLSAPLAWSDDGVIDLADLHRFFVNPSAAFLSQRLEVRVPTVDDEVPTVLPMDLCGLEGWGVGNRLLEGRVAGWTFDQWLEYERSLGTLPPGPLGDAAIETLGATVDDLVTTARRLGMRSGSTESYPVDATLPDGTRVVGSVQGRLEPATPGPVRLLYSKSKPTHRVASWLDLMALSATDSDTRWRSLVVSRPERPGAEAVVTDFVTSPGIESGVYRAVDALTVAVDCFRRGMAEPIPLFPTFSYQVYRGKDSVQAWSGYHFPEDGDHPAVRLAFDNADYETIMQLPAKPSDPPGVKGRVWRFAVHLHRTIDTSTAPSRYVGTPVSATDPARSSAGMGG